MKSLFKTFVVAATLSLTTTVFADGYADKEILISAEDAIKLIGKEKVMFVSGDDADIYKLGHIKDSVEMYAHHLHHSDITGVMHCEPLYRCIDDAEAYIGSKGITNDTLVIAYDDFKGPNATGVYSFFKSYGHDKVKVLNGGRNAIMELDPAQQKVNALRETLKEKKAVEKEAKNALKTAQGEAKSKLEAELKALAAEFKNINDAIAKEEKNLLVVKGDEVVKTVKYKIDQSKIDMSEIAGKEEVKKAMEDIIKNGDKSNFIIIDSRGMAEITGDRKMDNVARGGHIPGAKFIEWNKISDMKNKKSFKSAKELEEVYAKNGVSKDKTIYAYCMVGAGRGSEHITALKLLGYKNIKVFTGSWDVWGNDMNLPLKR